ncbi:transcription factor Ouib-like [Episyrphus balteatus]|uniref:transcription factor Ouib-like n=1 Tax=Episyrphus balteatus TaxID=286459 RepID=UPI002486558C|nr:transcription factor Ouib-like [Episyrphus balteatus]
MNSVDCCRICLIPDENSEMESLFKEFPEKNLIIEKIELCGGIKIEVRDDLPRKICEQCLFSLNVSYDFRNLCQTNDLKLKDIYVSEKLEIKAEPTTDRIPVLEIQEAASYLSEHSNDSSDYVPCENEIKDEDDDDGEEDENDKEYKPIMQTKKKKNKSPASLPFPAKRLGRRPKKKEIQICELCGNVYSRPSLLVMHMRRHADEKPFSCEICQKRFTCQSEINRHMRVHTGVRPFKCQYCDRRFSDRSTNIKHERTHTNERPFECGTCGKAFTYSNVLKNHMLTHTGEKRFKCEICNKTFSRTHQLKQHLLTIIHQQKEAQLNIYTKVEVISNDDVVIS